MATFTYSTTAMNYKTLLAGLARLSLRNHEPHFQVFFRAVNSHVGFFHTPSGQGRPVWTFGCGENTGALA